MKFELRTCGAAILLLVALVASTSRAQLVETGRILTPKKKDLGAIIEKTLNAPREPSRARPQPTSRQHSKPAGVSPRARALPDTFISDTEDPASILDINAEVLTRFSAALAVETAKRGDTKIPLTRARGDSIGAKAGGFTPRQYFVLKARLRPFCEAIAGGRETPADQTLAYMPTEAMAIKPRCFELLPALQQNWAAIQSHQRQSAAPPKT